MAGGLLPLSGGIVPTLSTDLFELDKLLFLLGCKVFQVTRKPCCARGGGGGGGRVIVGRGRGARQVLGLAVVGLCSPKHGDGCVFESGIVPCKKKVAECDRGRKRGGQPQ